MKRLPVLALLLAATAACVTMGATGQQLRARAAFDFNCPEQEIQLVEIDDRTRGVRGCGQQATYVEHCKPCANGYPACECTWLLNTDGRKAPDRESTSGL